MRRVFADLLLEAMKDERIFLLVGDLGWKVWDEHFKQFPERCVNTGAAEQAMLDMAVGLAYDGKIPFCYSITPFLIYRPYETLRTYVNHENLPVKLVGSGRDDDYKHDGFSHNASDVKAVLEPLQNVKQFWPQSKEAIPQALDDMIKNNQPSFISLKK